MTAPKVRVDWTINLTHIVLIVSSAFAITWTWQDNQRTLVDHKRDIAELKSVVALMSPKLVAIETQLDYTVKTVDRIDQRTESRMGR